MLKINIIAVGKNKETWVDQSISHYLKYLRKFASITFDYIPDKGKNRKMSASEIMKVEADLIKAKIKSNHIIALTDRGKKMDSIAFSDWLSNLMQRSGGACDFLVGGINGLDPSLMGSCNEEISLSPLTMSHQLIRPVLLEQLYRGFSILSGGKYHK